MTADAVIAHLARFGAPTTIVETSAGLRVHVVPPRDDDEAADDDADVWTLFTTGMSARAMAVPDVTIPAHAELIARLPADWAVDAAGWAASWPVRWLDAIARLSHASWLGLGHTIPNGDPPRALAADTAQCCLMLVAPTCLDDGDDVIATPTGPIALLALLPIYREEMQLKLDAGVDALLARLDADDIDETFALARRNVGIAPIKHSKRR